MCGICGMVSSLPVGREHMERVARMNRGMLHRGPDDSGEYSDAHIAMAMRRLSIIDLTGGRQPLYSEDRTLVLLCNGEIYNFIELRNQLERKGHHFCTATDGETILHLYEDHGLECVHFLRGMFAFALWDMPRKQLMLARDRMGEKPLYLHQDGETLMFASELKGLLCSGRVPFELDPLSINQYFHYQYVPEPGTPLKGVRKLDAGQILTVGVDPWRMDEECYWRMEDAPPVEGDPSELIRAELERVSELVIRADVPVGVALSGGLDSGAITALAASRYRGTLHAFSVGYTGRPPNDERQDAKFLADTLKIPFHELELTTRDMVAFFPELVLWRDDPIADLAGYGYYAVMKLARKFNIPVVLQGQGGDELFWGYSWVRWAVRKTAQKDALLKRGISGLPLLIKEKRPKGGDVKSTLLWLLKGAGVASALKEYWLMKSKPAERVVFYDIFKDFIQAQREMSVLYDPSMNEALLGADVCEHFTVSRPWPPVGVLLTRLICATYLRENGITQGDRLSMASGVELRLPLLDHKLVELVIGLRKTTPDDQLPQKSWLRNALAGVVPDEIMRRPKRGFAPPLREWQRALFDEYGRHLEDGYLVSEKILSPEAGHVLAQGDYPAEVSTPLSFKALALEMWCRGASTLVRS